MRSCAALLVSSILAAQTSSETSGRLVTAEELLGPLQKSGADHGDPVFIPGTHKLLITRTPPGKPTIMEVVDIDSGVERNVGEGDQPVLSPDGKKVAFLVGNTGRALFWEETQLWVSDVDGAHRRQLTRAEHGLGMLFLTSYAWAPDSTRLAYEFVPTLRRRDVKTIPAAADGPDALTVSVFSGASLQPEQRDETEFHIASLTNDEDRTVFKGQFDECGSLAWNGRTDSLIADVANFVPGENALQMTASIVSISIRDGALTKLVTDLGRQIVHQPKLSPDGMKIAFSADRWNRRFPEEMTLAVYDYATNKVDFLSKDDRIERAIGWDAASEKILFFRRTGLTGTLYKFNWKSKQEELVRGVDTFGRNSDLVESNDGRWAAWVNTQQPTLIAKLYVREAQTAEKRLLRVLADPTAGFATGKVEQFTWKSKDGLEVEGFLISPLGFSRDKKYPLLVNLHGGPTGGVYAQGPLLFHSPLELHYWAARGYMIFVPDYRQSQACGPACGWNQVVKRREANDMFERDLDDIMSGVDAVIARGNVDTDRMAIVGQSWGSYETNWVITHTNIFKAAISFEGGDLFMDWDMPRYGANDSTEWYLQGSPLNNLAAYEKESPVFHAANISTPTMFVNGELGINSPSLPWLYAALRWRGIDTEFVYYAKEGHGITRLANQRDLLQRGTEWIDKHLHVGNYAAS